MQIEPQAPFRLSKEPDGTQHAIKDNIQITVLPDVEDCIIKHRVANKPYAEKSARWLLVTIGDLKMYVNGTHVVVTNRDLNPTFDIPTVNDYVDEVFKRIKIVKDTKGRYIIDTDRNRAKLQTILKSLELDSSASALNKLRHGTDKGLNDGFDKN